MNPVRVKADLLPNLKNILNGSYDGTTPEVSGDVSLGSHDAAAYRVLLDRCRDKLEKNNKFTGEMKPIGAGGVVVPVNDLRIALKSLPAESTLEVDIETFQ